MFKGSLGRCFHPHAHTESLGEAYFSPYGPRVVSVHSEYTLGHLRYVLTDVPPQPNSPSGTVPCPFPQGTEAPLPSGEAPPLTSRDRPRKGVGPRAVWLTHTPGLEARLPVDFEKQPATRLPAHPAGRQVRPEAVCRRNKVSRAIAERAVFQG